MANILLLGAGFSKNWGAPVASEFFTALIADEEIQRNPQMLELLWRNRTNFEEALAQLQHSYRQNKEANREPLQLFLRAMLQIFDRTTTIFKRQDFEVWQEGLTVDRSRRVVEFLAKFDAIFTLNQDLLLEIHYFDQHHNTSTSRRWGSNALPGMTAAGQETEQGRPWSSRIWKPEGDFNISNNVQPYFKLHGSRNWRTSENTEDIIIMGGGKDAAIRQFPVLQRYQALFAEYVKRPDTRLTVIGYGFGDGHINETLKDAVAGGLKMYVIDPRGAAIGYESRPVKEWQIGSGPSELEIWFQKGLYSASVIPFRRLLIDESVDREVLGDFLARK